MCGYTATHGRSRRPMAAHGDARRPQPLLHITTRTTPHLLQPHCLTTLCLTTLCLAFFKSHGHTATWPHGHMATRPHAWPHAWPHGHTATRPHSHNGHTATRPHGHTATRPHGHTASRHHGHTATWQHGNTASRHHGIMTLWLHGQEATGSHDHMSRQRHLFIYDCIAFLNNSIITTVTSQLREQHAFASSQTAPPSPHRPPLHSNKTLPLIKRRSRGSCLARLSVAAGLGYPGNSQGPPGMSDAAPTAKCPAPPRPAFLAAAQGWPSA